MKQLTSLTCSKVGNCSLLFSLDRRYKNKSGEYPIVITCTLNYKRYYHRIGEFTTDKYFTEVCNVTSSKNSLMKKKKEWESILEGYRTRLAKVAEKQQLTLPLISAVLSGVDIHGEANNSFISIWENIIASRRKEGRAGTAQSYNCALNSFRMILGEVPGFAIDKNVIQRWNEGMMNGIMQNGKTVGKIADATRGIYLRTCRVIWHEAVRQGFLSEVEYPFSNKNSSLISIPRGKRRQKSYLSIEEWTQLYQVFVEKRYPDNWDPIYKERVHDSLGLLLAQYLCNGCNLADIARLRYNDTYWKEGGKAFEFERKKTSAQSNDNAVVIVPIIEPLQNILDEIAAPPTKGGYVFPQVFHGIRDEEERRRLTLKENCNIKDRVRKVCKEVLHWDKELVSGTWARHSFATNLKLAGVEEEYIAESMGHSHGNDVTRGYQDMYPLKTRKENNQKLLKLEEDVTGALDVDNMSVEEMKNLIKYFVKIQKNRH